MTSDQELYGIDPKDGGAMTFEALDMILKMWSSEPPYELEGKYWNIRLKKTVDEETGIGWGEDPEPDDEDRLRRDRPPHWDQ